jgi:hypothetical protein
MSDEVLIEPRSRRAILAALGGGLAALIAQAIGRPLPVRGANTDPVNVGEAETGTIETSISVTGTATAFRGESVQGYGLKGVSSDVSSDSATNTGVVGIAGAAGGAESDTHQTGVYGFTAGNDSAGQGVWGDSAALGVWGTGGDWGVQGDGYWGLVGIGTDLVEGNIGVYARGDTGVYAQTGSTAGPAPALNTAVHAYAPWPNNAARLDGRITFTRSGAVVVPAGLNYGQVAIRLASSSLIFGLVRTNRSGFFVTRAVTFNAFQTNSFFRIYLNANAPTGGIQVAWFVLN